MKKKYNKFKKSVFLLKAYVEGITLLGEKKYYIAFMPTKKRIAIKRNGNINWIYIKSKIYFRPFIDEINFEESTKTIHFDENKKDLMKKNDSFERSAAIERAYVQDVYELKDVYENLENETINNSTVVRSKIIQLLNQLDAGSIICDVGCGKGRYLTSNPITYYSIGVERCYRFANIAKSSSLEVII